MCFSAAGSFMLSGLAGVGTIGIADARNCRFPGVVFKLNGDGLPKTLPDSARVTSIEINVRRRETMDSSCRPRTPGDSARG